MKSEDLVDMLFMALAGAGCVVLLLMFKRGFWIWIALVGVILIIEL